MVERQRSYGGWHAQRGARCAVGPKQLGLAPCSADSYNPRCRRGCSWFGERSRVEFISCGDIADSHRVILMAVKCGDQRTVVRRTNFKNGGDGLRLIRVLDCRLLYKAAASPALPRLEPWNS
jgi:hypothetical protein